MREYAINMTLPELQAIDEVFMIALDEGLMPDLGDSVWTAIQHVIAMAEDLEPLTQTEVLAHYGLFASTEVID